MKKYIGFTLIFAALVVVLSVSFTANAVPQAVWLSLERNNGSDSAPTTELKLTFDKAILQYIQSGDTSYDELNQYKTTPGSRLDIEDIMKIRQAASE
jgi:hypothetical protein